ncbi:hypothetical protein [[Clostridium] aminophilum]|uniref:hypothetical protein n=1 Tax=[Clostridium] aminophilum TaxID=1526 RepID=UPI003328776C
MAALVIPGIKTEMRDDGRGSGLVRFGPFYIGVLCGISSAVLDNVPDGKSHGGIVQTCRNRKYSRHEIGGKQTWRTENHLFR